MATGIEAEKLDIGVVEKIASPSTLRVQLTGVGGHAGATLMPGRRDAALAGAEIALAVEKAATTSGSPDTVGTTGIFAALLPPLAPLLSPRQLKNKTTRNCLQTKSA